MSSPLRPIPQSTKAVKEKTKESTRIPVERFTSPRRRRARNNATCHVVCRVSCVTAKSGSLPSAFAFSPASRLGFLSENAKERGLALGRGPMPPSGALSPLGARVAPQPPHTFVVSCFDILLTVTLKVHDTPLLTYRRALWRARNVPRHALGRRARIFTAFWLQGRGDRGGRAGHTYLLT